MYNLKIFPIIYLYFCTKIKINMCNFQLNTQIENLLYSTRRPGIESVIDHFHCNGDAFYNVPASTKFHDNQQGGLALHSLNVYLEAKTMFEKLVATGEHPSFGMDSVILCSILHDVCKIDEYEIVHGKSQHTSQYNHCGPHGMKSERLLREWKLALSDDERQAIIWHMGAYAYDACEKYNTTYRTVAAASRLVKLIHEADHHAAKTSHKAI